MERVSSFLKSLSRKKVDAAQLHPAGKAAASRFDPKELGVLRITWQEMADRSDGKGIDKDTFMQCFPMNGLFSERLFLQFDKKMTGFIDFDDYIIGLSKICRGSQDDKMRFIFDMYDLTRDHFISKAELTTLLNHLPKSLLPQSQDVCGDSPTERACREDEVAGVDRYTNHDAVERAFEECNLSHTGKLSFDEFKAWVEKNPYVIDYVAHALPYHSPAETQSRDGLLPRTNSTSSGESNHRLSRPASASVLSASDSFQTLGDDSWHGDALLDSAPSSPISPPEESSVVRQGVLWKKGQSVLHMWSSRFYVVSGNAVYYYARKDDVAPRGVIFLAGSLVEKVVDADLASKGYFGLELLHQELCGGEPHEHHKHEHRMLFCRTEAERDEWVTVLQRAAAVVPIEQEYHIGELLGTGRFSTVRECVQKATGATMAVKIIRKDNIEPDQKKLLWTEITVLKLLRHPSIVRLEGLHEDKHSFYLVMEKVGGGDLFDSIVGKPRKGDEEASKIVRQLLESVAYLHDLGIVHRDLKPENILCGDDAEEVKIADFGLSKMISPTEKMMDPCGSLSYIAPEVLAMTGYGKEVDLWSVGVILVLLVCGQLPFDDETDDQVTMSNILKGDLKVNPSTWDKLSEDAKSLITSLLSLDRNDRPLARVALKHPFFTKYAPSKKSSISANADSGYESAPTIEKQTEDVLEAPVSVVAEPSPVESEHNGYALSPPGADDESASAPLELNDKPESTVTGNRVDIESAASENHDTELQANADSGYESAPAIEKQTEDVVEAPVSVVAEPSPVESEHNGYALSSPGAADESVSAPLELSDKPETTDTGNESAAFEDPESKLHPFDSAAEAVDAEAKDMGTDSLLRTGEDVLNENGTPSFREV